MPYRRFDLKQAADYLHLPLADFAEMVQRGEVPCERQGTRCVFLKKELDAWASQRILGLRERRLAAYHQRTTAKTHNLSASHAIVSELLRREVVTASLASRTKPSVLRDMVTLAEKTGLVNYPTELLASLQERERLCSTALPDGLALLHPRHHEPYAFADSFIILARTVQPIPFGAPDGEPTDIFFLICCQDDRIHLHVLARLCMMCQQTSLVADLRAAEEATAMCAAVERAEAEVIRRL